MGQQEATCGTAKSSLDWFVIEERAAKQSLNGLSARIGTGPGELRESFELPIGAILASQFYSFSLEGHVPADHLLRLIDRFVDLGDLREHLRP